MATQFRKITRMLFQRMRMVMKNTLKKLRTFWPPEMAQKIKNCWFLANFGIFWHSTNQFSCWLAVSYTLNVLNCQPMISEVVRVTWPACEVTSLILGAVIDPRMLKLWPAWNLKSLYSKFAQETLLELFSLKSIFHGLRVNLYLSLVIETIL